MNISPRVLSILRSRAEIAVNEVTHTSEGELTPTVAIFRAISYFRLGRVATPSHMEEWILLRPTPGRGARRLSLFTAGKVGVKAEQEDLWTALTTKVRKKDLSPRPFRKIRSSLST